VRRSFTPSPTIATRFPFPFSSRILSTLSAGSFGALDDALRYGVFGVALDTGGDPERFGRVERAVGRNVNDPEFAASERAGLVEDDGRQVSSFLEFADRAPGAPNVPPASWKSQ
jgi:hypothetical protein